MAEIKEKTKEGTGLEGAAPNGDRFDHSASANKVTPFATVQATNISPGENFISGTGLSNGDDEMFQFQFMDNPNIDISSELKDYLADATRVLGEDKVPATPQQREFLKAYSPHEVHPLNYKMDPAKDYGDDISFDEDGVIEKPVCEESYFFYTLAVVINLENQVKALEGVELTRKEALILWRASMAALNMHPQLRGPHVGDTDHPTHTGLRKLIKRLGPNERVWLTPSEGFQLYKICGLIPRPKPQKESDSGDADSDYPDPFTDEYGHSTLARSPTSQETDEEKNSLSWKTSEISPPYLISPAHLTFSFIQDTIEKFERHSIVGGGMTIAACDVYGTFKACMTLHQTNPDLFVDHGESSTHPHISAMSKLHGSFSAAISTSLNAEEAACLLKMLRRFQRNIVFDAADGSSGCSDFRLMTQQEMAEKLSSGMFVMLSSIRAIGAIENIIRLMVPVPRKVSTRLEYTKILAVQVPAKNFSNPKLRAAISQLDLPSTTGLLAHVKLFLSQYPSELNDAMVLRTQSPADIVANIGKKLLTASDLACLPNGGNQIVQLRSLEAFVLARILGAAHLSLLAADVRVELLTKDMLPLLKSGQHGDLCEIYAEEAERMSEFVKSKRFAVYGTALGGNRASSEALQLATLAAERDDMASRQKYSSTMIAWLLSMTQQLKRLVKLLSSPGFQGSDNLHELIKTELKSLSWRASKDQLGIAEGNVRKANDELKAASATKKQRKNEQAHNLLQALANHVQKTSGKDTYKALVWETCGSPIAGALTTDSTVPEETPGLILNTILSDSPPEKDPQLGPGYELDAENPIIAKEISSVLNFEALAQSSNSREWRRYLVADIKLRQEERDNAVLDQGNIENRLAGEIAKRQQAEFDLSRKEQEHQAAMGVIERLNQKERDFTAKAAMLMPDHNGMWVNSVSGEVNFDKVVASLANLASKAHNAKRRFQACEDDVDDLWKVLSAFVPPVLMQNDYTGRELRNARFFAIIKASKTLIKARDEALKQAENTSKQNETLRQEVAAKDRQLEGKEGDLVAAREFRGQIDERRKAELSKKESELTALQLELKNSQADFEGFKLAGKKQIDRAREINKRAKSDLKAVTDELNIAKLDEEAARNELLQHRADVQQLKAARDEAAELRKERDAQKIKFVAQKIDAKNQKDKFDKDRAEKHVLNGALSRKVDEILSLQAKFAKFQEALEKAAAAKDQEILKLREENSEFLDDYKNSGATIKNLETSIQELVKEKEESENVNCELLKKVSALSAAQEMAEKDQDVLKAKLTDDIKAQVKAELETDFDQTLAKERAKVKGLEGLLSMYISKE